MESEIGSTLRDARNRRKIDLSEVEATTKIRVRFLRAMENEEWDVLPGDIYTRAFIKTYASFLGLDGERLAESFRGEGGAPDRAPSRVEPALSARRQPTRSRAGSRILAVVVVAALIGAVLAIALASGGGGLQPSQQELGLRAPRGRAMPRRPLRQRRRRPASRSASKPPMKSGSASSTPPRKPVIKGQILAAGETEGPFHSDEFSVAFGNGSVAMEIDGRPADLPESSSPIGFAVDGKGRLTELQEGERPDCA